MDTTTKTLLIEDFIAQLDFADLFDKWYYKRCTKKTKYPLNPPAGDYSTTILDILDLADNICEARLARPSRQELKEQVAAEVERITERRRRGGLRTEEN